MEVTVVGGGIGGLATALALVRTGHDVVVLERSPQITEAGAGIQVSPNGARALHALGLGEALDRIAVRPARIVVRRWQDDAVLRATPLGERFVARYGLPYSNVHRHDVITVLGDALAAERRVELRLGRAVQAVHDGADTGSATVHCAGGEQVSGDVVIGADGIRSAVRDAVIGASPSRFSGAVAYQVLVPRDRVPHVPLEVTNRVGPDAHVVTYFVGRDAAWLNLVCVTPEDAWDVESWTEIGSVDALQSAFSSWAAPLRAVLDEVRDPIHRWALHDRLPLDRWVTGRVALLGDACHPMLPFMAQGACQALEDAVVLADELSGVDAARAPQALARYEARRRPRTDSVQRLSWANRTTFHLADGDEQRRRDERFAVGGEDLSSFDWLYGFDAARPQ